MTVAGDTPLELLTAWLERRLAGDAAVWLRERLEALAGGTSDRDLFLAVSLVPRKLGKEDLGLGPEDLAAAERARAGWNPGDWSVDQAARLALLLAGGGNGERFAARLEQLCTTADVAELIAFYRGLPLYPDPELHVARAGEGARTNMKAVFEAVAHRNPYPAERFDETAWNHMVLKALFVGSTLHPIIGIDRRHNPDLMRMLCDYAHERWAAGRDLSPELWRCVGPEADDGAMRDLERLLASETPLERQAAALALAASGHAQAPSLLQAVPDLAARIESGALSWETVYNDLSRA